MLSQQGRLRHEHRTSVHRSTIDPGAVRAGAGYLELP